MTGELILENGIVVAYLKLSEIVPVIFKNRHEYEHFMAFGLLNEVLEKHFKKSLSDFTLKKEEKGKPYFEKSGIYFNISHSKTYVVCAVSSKYEVGIDVEVPREINESILKKVFSDAEMKGYENSNDKNKYFLRAWTYKESMAKLTGEGIGQDFKLLDFENVLKESKVAYFAYGKICRATNFAQWLFDENMIISLSYNKVLKK